MLTGAKVQVTDADGTNQGYIDASQRVYQHGGQVYNFYYRKGHGISISMVAWLKILATPEVHLIEMVDSPKGGGPTSVWRTDVQRAAASGHDYYARGEERFCIPRSQWGVFDEDWDILPTPTEEDIERRRVQAKNAS